MLRSIVFSALGAGIAVGICLTALQLFTTTPLILDAEVFESGGGHVHEAAGEAPADASVAAGDAPQQASEAEAWQPADGVERTLYTALANLLVGVAVSLILVGLMVVKGGPIDARHGVLWGLGGFVAASLLPSLGLPPELPGTAAAEITGRQIWWLVTAIVSGAGIALIVFGGWGFRIVGVALLVVPHVIGAPPPPTHDAPYPAGLAGKFVIASLVASFVMWSLAGLVGGWLHERLARPA